MTLTICRRLIVLFGSFILTKLYVGMRNFVHRQRFGLAEITSYY